MKYPARHPSNMRSNRLRDEPIITPELHPSIGVNIQGPSAIRVAEWIRSNMLRIASPPP